MTFIYAGKFHRFIVYLIDFVLLSIASSYVYGAISKALQIDSSTGDAYYQLMLSELLGMLQGGINEENITYFAEQYLLRLLVDRILSLSILLVFIIGLLIVLPIFWKGQTIGRYFFHLTLYTKDGKPATAKNFILRELVGTMLFYALFGTLGIIITLICVAAKNRSIADIVSGTHLCYQPEYLEKHGINPNANNDNLNNNYNENYSENYNDYNDTNIDADWHDVDSTNENSESDDADSEDDYKIF